MKYAMLIVVLLCSGCYTSLEMDQAAGDRVAAKYRDQIPVFPEVRVGDSYASLVSKLAEEPHITVESRTEATGASQIMYRVNRPIITDSFVIVTVIDGTIRQITR